VGQPSQKRFGPFCGQLEVQESFHGKQIVVRSLGFWQFDGQAIAGCSKVFCAIDGGIWGQMERVVEG